MGRSIHPMGRRRFTAGGGPSSGRVPRLIVWMSLGPAIPSAGWSLPEPASASPAGFYVPSAGWNCQPPPPKGWGIFDRPNGKFLTGVDRHLVCPALSSPEWNSTLATTRRALVQPAAWYMKLLYRTIGLAVFRQPRAVGDPARGLPRRRKCSGPSLGQCWRGGEGRRKEESRDEEAVGVAHQKRQDGGWAPRLALRRPFSRRLQYAMEERPDFIWDGSRRRSARTNRSLAEKKTALAPLFLIARNASQRHLEGSAEQGPGGATAD